MSKENPLQRVCHFCKGDIILDKDKNYIYHEKNKSSKLYYHFNCYVNYELAKKTNKLSKEEIIKKASELKEKGKTTPYIVIYREYITRWLFDNYNITKIPNSFYTKLANIHNGNQLGLKKGIPLEHILDMWKRKQTELNKIYNQQKAKGKDKDVQQRINYDLGILINKYDNYLKWREQQDIMKRETLQRVEESQKQQINIEKINKVVENNQHKKDELDIADILDEFF